MFSGRYNMERDEFFAKQGLFLMQSDNYSAFKGIKNKSIVVEHEGQIKAVLTPDATMSKVYFEDESYLGGLFSNLKKLKNPKFTIMQDDENFWKIYFAAVDNKFKPEASTTLRIPLSKYTEDSLFESIDKKTRNAIRKAEKWGIKIKSHHEVENWAEKYLELDLELRKRRGFLIKKGVEDIKKFEKLNNVRIFFAEFEGKIVGSTVLVFFGSNAYLLANASLTEYMKYKPNNCLYWRNIQECFRHKINYFYLGGTANDYQKRHFKSGFGAEPVLTITFSKLTGLKGFAGKIISKLDKINRLDFSKITKSFFKHDKNSTSSSEL